VYISTFTTLQTALQGVEAAQEELDTTGENITNANTPDYEQQRVNLVESNPLTVAGGAGGSPYQLGTGVDATSITNVGSPYLDAAWRQQNANSNGATTMQTYMQQIQTSLNEPSATGINAQLSQFWSDWNSLSDNPTSQAAQQAVVNDGEELSTSFNSLSAELTGTQATSIMSQAQAQYSNLLGGPASTGASGGEVYNDAYNVASLNQAIVQATQAGQSPNTLIDQRNEVLDNLSSLGNTTVQNNSDGSVTVYFGGITGTALVDDPVGSGAPVGTPDPGNNFSSTWLTAFNGQFANADAAAAAAAASSGGTQSAAVYAQTVGGTIGNLIGLAGFSATGLNSSATPATSIGVIGNVSNGLDAVANTLVNEVNTPGVENSNPPTTIALTTPFFVTTGTTASTMAVNPALITNAANLQVNSTGIPGDNDIALDEANNAGGAADSSYQAFVQQVGDLAQGANSNETTQSALGVQITNQRQSVEGVDLSQEMANLVQQQQAYQASAKVMNAFSTVMDSLMSVVGQ
jgi:flagellar hook-associated protein 1